MDCWSIVKVSNIGHKDLFCDNKAAIQIALNLIFHERTMPIGIGCHLVRDNMAKGVVATKFVSLDSQLEVIFTKVLNSLMLNKMSNNRGLVDFF